ncbi:MAG TPA: nuclear transport factor 2 family protein [Gemmatimonadales bacterium]|nr:nuclear transport factor 2 family protein [Gemmatimonadales bacterium]
MSVRVAFGIAAVSLTLAGPALPQTAGAGQVVAGQTTITLPDTAAYSPTARQILALEVKRSAAIASRDTAWLATLYSPDFKGVPAGGQRVDRAALFRVFSRDAPELRFAIDELEVRDFGTSATVMGRLRTTTRDGQSLGESRYLHLYVPRKGHWWIVAAVGSAVLPPRPQQK